MKKLMTAIAAVTAAFGLYAADLSGSMISFEANDPGVTEEPETGVGVFDPTADGLWFGYTADTTLEVKAHETAVPHKNADIIGEYGDKNDNYLWIEADAPVFRTFAEVPDQEGTMDPVAIEDTEAERGGIIADQLVKFSAFDADTTTVELEDGAKIAVWLKTLTEGPTEEDNTYALMATCGALDEIYEPGETAATVQLEVEGKTLKPGEWHQLTITAIKALEFDPGDAVAGFKVEVDGVTAKAVAGSATLFPENWDTDGFATEEAKTLIPNGELFPSFVSHTETDAMTLQGIAFKGTGAVDDIAIKAKDPVASATTINVALADGVTAVAEPGEFDNEKGTWTFPKGTETGTITLTAPKGKLFKSNGKDTLVLENVDLTKGDLDYSDEEVDDAVAQIGSVLYLTLQEAIGVGGDITLLQDVAEQITVPADNTVVLDLNEKTIATTSWAIYNQGTFTLKNGTVTSTGAQAIWNAGTLTIEGGAYNSREMAVVLMGSSVTTIAGGTFTATDNAVIGGQGAKVNDNVTLTINGGTFNGSIMSDGYIACGIYVANSGTYTINGGTFNITGGCGICARAGVTTVNGGVWNVSGDATGKVGDKDVDVACDVFVEEFSDPQYPGYDPTACIFVPGKVNEELNPVKANKDFADADVLEEGFETKLVDNFYTVVESQSEEPDPTEKDPEEIPADKTAGEYFPNIAQNDITNANAKAVATWCQKDGVTGTVEAGGANIDPDAFLLDCANTEKAVEDAKKAFTITSITQDADGNWVVVVANEYGEAEAYGNGFVEIVDVTSTIKGVDAENAKLFKAKLVFKQPSVE